MNSEELDSSCIYTTRGLRELDQIRRTPGAPLIERRWWAEGERLLERSRRAGTRLPLVFSDGAQCARLVGWGLVDEIRRHPDGTAVKFSGWTPIDGPRTQELVSLNKGRAIADDYVRPYVPCETPWFIRYQRSTSPVGQVPRAWIIKGKPRNDFATILVPHARGRWETGKPPAAWRDGDFVFFWESSPAKRVVGLGRIESTAEGVERGLQLFVVEYLTGKLSHPLGASTLQQAPQLAGASFLKAGPAGTVFPLTPDQATALAELVVESNPSSEAVFEDHLLGVGALAASRAVQRNDLDSDDVMDPEELALFEAREGRRILLEHVVFERSTRLRNLAKKRHRAVTGGMACLVCRFDFEATYGELGQDFAEVHHLNPLSMRNRATERTFVSELAVVCANCHRMLHRDGLLSTDELRSRLAGAVPNQNLPSAETVSRGMNAGSNGE